MCHGGSIRWKKRPVQVSLLLSFFCPQEFYFQISTCLHVIIFFLSFFFPPLLSFFFGSETRFRRITSGPKKLPQTVAYLFQNHNKMAPPIVGLKQIMWCGLGLSSPNVQDSLPINHCSSPRHDSLAIEYIILHFLTFPGTSLTWSRLRVSVITLYLW